MTVLTPQALALFVLAVPILLLYILKLKRQEHQVASTLLWRRALDDVQANVPWQRLRLNLLLLLQLLALVALVIGMAGPAILHAEAISDDLIVLVDQSYAMQARDVAPTRFEVAIRQVRGLASSLGSGHVLSVVGMGDSPHLAVVESADSAAVARGLAALQPTARTANFAAALSLARSLARRGQPTRVVVLTSRDSGIAGVSASVPFPVQIVRLGGSLRDLAVVSLSAQEANGQTHVVAEIRNLGVQRAQSDLDLFSDGQIADVRPLNLAPGAAQTIRWTDLPAGIHDVVAHLAHADNIAADDSAFAVIPYPVVRRVLLVSSGNYFLQTALAIDPSVQVSTIPPAAYSSRLAQNFDLAVFDGYLPATMPPASSLIVAPPAGSSGSLRFGHPRSVSRITIAGNSGGASTSILTYTNFSDVHVAQVRSVVLPSWMHPLVVAGSMPVVAAGHSGLQRVAVLTFDLQDTDWPLRVGFPIAIRDLVHFLAPAVSVTRPHIRTGEAETILPAPGTQHVEVVDPRGHTHSVAPPFDHFAATGTPGVYTVRETGGAVARTAQFAVTDFAPTLQHVEGPAVVSTGGRERGTVHQSTQTLSAAWAFGAAALFLLCLEWWVAYRR